MIASQAHRFSIPESVHYLNCAYMAPLADTVSAAMVEGAGLKKHPWGFRPADFFTLSEDFRSAAAEVAGISAECVAIVPSVSYALATAAANLPLQRGQRIVTLADQFPSNVYAWRELAAREGGEVLAVERPSQDDWTGAVLEAIDERTAIAALPHNHWADGRVVDLVAVGERCRAVGAALVLDLTQSLGAAPLDLAAVRPDFAVAACYKWMMGPYGIGMLYVDPKHHGGTPLEHNWINRAGSEDFARLVDYREDFQPGARRFDMGEGANFSALPMAVAALEQLLEWGVDNIQSTLTDITDRIAERAVPLGLSALASGDRAGHFLGLGFPGEVPTSLPEQLAQRKVFVSMRGQSMRVTPHLYNNDVDIKRLISVLETAL